MRETLLKEDTPHFEEYPQKIMGGDGVVKILLRFYTGKSMNNYDENCLFCKIVKGKEPSKKVLETDKFLVIHNKYPIAPVHLLVLDKSHNKKEDTISGNLNPYWDDFIKAVWKAIKYFNLDKTGYKLVLNGAGYNHFEHEHMHILGGTKEEPGGRT